MTSSNVNQLSVAWTAPLPNPVGTPVYAGLINGVAALDLASGAIQWTRPSAGMVFFPLSVTGQNRDRRG